MSAPVEARSISALSTLFANPPQYPRNPTHQIHESLVLYIVRVPGSKDVFLTPLKPPTKTSISIDAVQSSLYFLHVERPEDGELRDSLETANAAGSRNKENVPIQRKPLPATPYANYPPSQRPPTPPKSYPYYQPPLANSRTASQAERHAARGTHLRLSISGTMSPLAISRKPVGARPMSMGPIAEPAGGPFAHEGSGISTPIGDEQGKFRLARKPVQSTSPVDAHQGSRARHERAAWECSNSPQSSLDSALSADTEAGRNPSQETLRITLIRRDPASSSQWNVGSIIYRESEAQENPLKAFDIELTSPGYVKFAQLEGSSSEGLHRKVAYMLVPPTEGSPATRQRSNSSELSPMNNGGPGKRPRQAFSFISPWQGMCSFNNGLDGKSIRCRHFLPSANPAMSSGAADVAELRFNLPWSILRLKDPPRKDKGFSEASPNTPTSHPPTASNREHWRRSIQSLTQKARLQLSHLDGSNDASHVGCAKQSSTQSGKSNDEDRLNLALGRERAGGGFKGQSAKLGKLIIDDEGLKMCDLVVAASMGIWWQHYAGDMSH